MDITSQHEALSRKRYTTKQAAELLGVSDVTLRRWRSQKTPGSPVFHRTGRGRVFYLETDLVDWLHSERVSGGRK